MIIIPAIDIMGGKCVRLTQGVRETQKVYGSDPAEQARAWAGAGVKRIHVVDLDGAFEGNSQNLSVVESIVKAVEIPIEVGGGIRSAAAVDRLIEIGVAYIVIGTIAIEKPQLASEIIEAHPARIYVGIDTRGGSVATHGWMSTSEKSHFEVIERAEEWGARGVVFTAIERDGEMIGPDIEALKAVAQRSHIPVIASGGVTQLRDIEEIAGISNIEGVIVGKALYEGAITLKDALNAAVPVG